MLSGPASVDRGFSLVCLDLPSQEDGSLVPTPGTWLLVSGT